MKRSLGASERIRQAVGLLVLIGVAVIALGLDTRVLCANSRRAQTAGDRDRARDASSARQATWRERRDDRPQWTAGPAGRRPDAVADGLGPWINSPPLTAEQLRGKVVLIDFWTYSCINCLRTLPYLKAWNERYARTGW